MLLFLHLCSFLACLPPPNPPANGAAQSNLSAIYLPGDNVTYECSSIFFTSDTTMATCESSGAWTPSLLNPCIQTRE